MMRADAPPPLARWGLIALAIVWAAVVIPVGTHKGGDFMLELAQSERLLQRLPLYDQAPPNGAWWPPFTALFLAPFALAGRLVSMAFARALWATLCAGCVIWSVGRAGLAWGWTPALVAFAVLVSPIQNSFQHLQITPVLLALVVAAALDLQAGRERRSGAWIGAATALKAFPALLLAYLAYHRRWRGVGVGIAVAAVLTIGAMLPYGPLEAFAAVKNWLLLSSVGTGVGGLHMQKLGRLGYAIGVPLPVIIGAEVAIGAAVAYALRRASQPDEALADVGMVTLLAVLVSPIGWYYYWGLLFPAAVAALRAKPAFHATTWYLLLAASAMLMSGLLTLVPLPEPLALVSSHGDTKGGLLLLGLLVAHRVHEPRRSPAPP